MKWLGLHLNVLLLLLLFGEQWIFPTDGAKLSVATLSKSERSAIKKLRLLVKDSLPHEYMKEDIYLLKWLSIRNFNVDQTVTSLKKHVKWREEQRMDNIWTEDWSEFHAYFQYRLNTIDREGRPVLYLPYGAWDVSDMANSGRLKKLSRYFAKLLEEAEGKVRDFRETGKDIAEFDLIVNMDGYSLSRHGCFQCLAFYSEIGDILQNHYPGAADKIVFINAPSIFANTFRILQTVLNDQTKDSIKLFGEDRYTWEPSLLEFISRDQFPGNLY